MRENRAVDALARRTLDLVDIPSESRAEGAAVEYVRRTMPTPPAYDDDTVLYWPGRVVLAGHLDTVPAQDNIPGAIEDGWVVGLGATDMKGGCAVMLELARVGAAFGFLFFGREELPAGESPLPGFFERQGLDCELVVMMEPTDNEIHAGCLGNLNARVTFRGESAHSARPWTGVNAIHELVRGLQGLAELEPNDVELDGLVYREVVSAVRVEGGIASNVVPAAASVELNYRFMRDDPEARLRELVPYGELTVLSNSPSAPPGLGNQHIRRLRELVPDVAPKQAWTPVAQFAEQGIDAINYGPGATVYAHRQDEQIPIENLHAVYETLARFIS